MKSYELLDVLGDVNEDYVRAADANVVRPRFRWKALAACAACAALALAAYPAYRASQPKLHDYAVIEDSGGVELESGLAEAFKAPAGGAQNDPAADCAPDEAPPVLSAPEAAPAEPGDAGVSSNRAAGTESKSAVEADSFDVAQTWAAIAQYQGLLQGMGGQDGLEPETYPDWYGGAWIDGAGDKLAVAIVDGFHTGGLEGQIEEWCGGEVVFVQDMKYSYAHLLSLNDQILQALQEHINQDDVWSTLTSLSPDMRANRLDVGFSGAPSDAALAFLARLDPDGDAIRVQVYAQSLDPLPDEVQKGPAPDASLAAPAQDDLSAGMDK